MHWAHLTTANYEQLRVRVGEVKRPLPPRTMGNPLSVFSKKDEPQEEVIAEVAVANPSFRRTREVQVANPSFRRGKPEAKPKVSHDNVASIGESVAMMLHSEFGHDHAEMLGDHMVRGTMCYMWSAAGGTRRHAIGSTLSTA